MDLPRYDITKTYRWNYDHPPSPGKQVLRQWLSYRKANRERPIIGDRRPPSKLGEIQPDHWLAEYTTELINVLHVLGRLIELEPAQSELLERICSGAILLADELRAAGAFEKPSMSPRASKRSDAKGQKRLLS